MTTQDCFIGCDPVRNSRSVRIQTDISCPAIKLARTLRSCLDLLSIKCYNMYSALRRDLVPDTASIVALVLCLQCLVELKISVETLTRPICRALIGHARSPGEANAAHRRRQGEHLYQCQHDPQEMLELHPFYHAQRFWTLETRIRKLHGLGLVEVSKSKVFEVAGFSGPKVRRWIQG